MLLLHSQAAKTQISSEINKPTRQQIQSRWQQSLDIHFAVTHNIPGISNTNVWFHLLSSYWEINQLKTWNHRLLCKAYEEFSRNVQTCSTSVQWELIWFGSFFVHNDPVFLNLFTTAWIDFVWNILKFVPEYSLCISYKTTFVISILHEQSLFQCVTHSVAL